MKHIVPSAPPTDSHHDDRRPVIQPTGPHDQESAGREYRRDPDHRTRTTTFGRKRKNSRLLLLRQIVACRSPPHSVERVDDEGVSREHEVGPVADLPTGTVVGAGGYAVGNIGGELFAVSRRCRHLGADLANGTLDEDGHLVCPWHRSAYDVHTGRMVRGPQGVFAKVPGLDAAYRALTRVLPLRRGQVLERNGRLFVR
jgi:nitrite reductase/ring-hydroxylating ferredoxin subunit